jgi:hypothetical protein
MYKVPAGIIGLTAKELQKIYKIVPKKIIKTALKIL